MRPVLSRKEVAEWERSLIERGVPEIVLMENAARGAAHWLGLKLKPRNQETAPRSSVRGSCVRCADEALLARAGRVVVLAGPGNNGGDAWALARHLMQRQAQVQVLFSGEPKEGSAAAQMMRAYRALGGKSGLLSVTELQRGSPPAWVVDGLFGTGLARALSDEMQKLAGFLLEQGAKVLALDLPSGLDADTGTSWGAVLHAQHTVTFGHLKRGLLTTQGHLFAGDITVSHLGVPSRLEQESGAYLIELSDLEGLLPARLPTLHKGMAGRLAVLGGEPEMAGAARLVAHAAFRTGVGTVTVVGSRALCDEVEKSTLETMVRRVAPSGELGTHLDGMDGVVAGPGLGQRDFAYRAISDLLSSDLALVLDADGLRCLAHRAGELGETFFRARSERADLYLTPHPGEAAELLNSSVKAIEADRFGAVSAIAERYAAQVILKGSRTLIAAPRGPTWVSTFGTKALATAGSGDTLAGILGALIAAKRSSALPTVDPAEHAILAVGLHGLAAEKWGERWGDRGLLASELADELPGTFRELEASRTLVERT